MSAELNHISINEIKRLIKRSRIVVHTKRTYSKHPSCWNMPFIKHTIAKRKRQQTKSGKMMRNVPIVVRSFVHSFNRSFVRFVRSFIPFALAESNEMAKEIQQRGDKSTISSSNVSERMRSRIYSFTYTMTVQLLTLCVAIIISLVGAHENKRKSRLEC